MPEPYAPRARGRLAPVRVGGMPMRVHWIDVEGDAAPPGSLLAAALAHAADALPPAVAAEGGAEGAGYLVLHRGRKGTWLLMHWWAHGDILCGHLARAEPGVATFASMDGRPLLACVWEMEVMALERDAWVATMMVPAPSLADWHAA